MLTTDNIPRAAHAASSHLEACKFVATLFAILASASRLPAAPAEADSPAVQTGSSQPVGAGGANAERIPEKVRRYAQRLLERYDTNRDGKLQRDEWSKMHGTPEAADVNADGVITLDELLGSIAAFGRNRRIGAPDSTAGASPRDQPAPPAAGIPTAAPGGTSAATPEGGQPLSPDPTAPPATEGSPRRATTFYVPKSRLPTGLPDWFGRRDLDGDGQLSLAEFAPNPTQADLEEFARYDRNGDGFITAREYLDAMKPARPSGRKAAAASDKSGEKSSRKKGAAGKP